MYIEGSPCSGKTSFLVDKFLDLIISGVSTSEILVVCQNSHKKNLFLNKIRQKLETSKLKGFGSFPINTFNGVVYHSIKDNWSVIEELLPDKLGNKKIIPELSGLGVSEYLLRESIRKVNRGEELEQTFRDYASHKHLKQQLFRRFRLIAENNLTKQEIAQKSQFLNEQFAGPAEKVLHELKVFSSKYRVFDYLSQTMLFISLLDAGKLNYAYIKYLLADDLDEFSHSAQYFLKYLMKDTKEFYIAADPDGGTRRGYLCANPKGYQELKELYPSKILKLTLDESCSKTACDAHKLFNSIKTDIIEELEAIKILHNTVRQTEMMDNFFAKLKTILFEKKIPADDIVIVAPVLDDTLVYLLKSFFEHEKIDCQLFSGSKKILDDKFVYGAAVLLQLINTNWKFPPKTAEVRSMLTGMLGFQTVYCKEILDFYDKNGVLDPNFRHESDDLNIKYQKIVKIINDASQKTLELQEQIEKIFHELIETDLSEGYSLENFNIMLQSLDAFRKISKKINNNNISGREWIILIKDTVVSDNPASAPDIKSGRVKIATHQKVIDLELRSKIQIWLDVSNSVWFKEDTGSMYNSWVFQKNWDGQEYTPSLHKQLTMEKTASLIRKLVLCAQEKIFCFASQFDQSGNENDGMLIKYLSGKEEKPEINYEFTPREDQIPVLNYKSGEMAVSAVPGAGKTKILEALIIKMLMQGVNPEKILVLTYMDSAARTIRDRINNSCENLSKFPYISTIHGLGLSIIRDGDNHNRLNLASDFQICDDSVRYRIMSDLYNRFATSMSLKDFINDYGAAISTIKQLEINEEEALKFISRKSAKIYEELCGFLPIYQEYQRNLKYKNMIDFDDILVYSVSLMKNNKEIRDYYKQKFDFIIEDEAQDSSFLQQELLSLVSKGNLIRCGDPNQAITSSFSASEVDNFKKFIETAPNSIKMTGSQRCAPEIIEFANSLVDWAESGNYLKGAFKNLHIKPVNGKNPDVKNSVKIKVYPAQEDEKHCISREIDQIRKTRANLSIGVLLRGNSAVIDWSNYLEENGIPCICHSDAVGQKKIFRFIKNCLEVINNPWNNLYIKDLYKEFSSENLITTDFDSKHFLDKLGSPFICFSDNDLPYDSLKEFKKHIVYWLDKTCVSPENLVNELGDFYFKGVIDRSNARILSLLIGKFRNAYTDNEKNEIITLSEVVEYLRELGMQKKLSGVRFFEEIEKTEHKSDFAQIMTVHKAKGQEFDVVFMPEVQESPFYYPINPENIEIGGRDRLINQIKQIRNRHLTTDDIKIRQIQENLRLIYVGITRAKMYLYISGSEISDKSWIKNNKFRPSEVLSSTFTNALF
ncbi:MAG TPA: ATP-dependent helicase [Candidatus Gastranaerophilales bacterium]|nr:ATP-dependent helicase [Candidatus Gastranaerophilales bacterium]